MQTVLRRDDVWRAWRDAALWAGAGAFSASYAGVGDVKAFRRNLGAAETETLAVDRLLAEIEKFHVGTVETKRFENVAALALVEIGDRCVGVENAVDPVFLVVETFHRAGNTDHLPVVVHPGHRDAASGAQLAVEILAAGSAKIERVVFAEHEVDDAHLWRTIFVHRRHGRAFYVEKNVQAIL